MTAKEFLRKVRDIDRRIDENQERVDRMRARLEAGRMTALTGMPRGGRNDWTDTMDRLISLEQRINARIREMCRLKHLAMDAIDQVNDARYRELLELYYIDGYTWEQVAKQMEYTDVRWVYVLHGRALRKVKVPEEAMRNSL